MYQRQCLAIIYIDIWDGISAGGTQMAPLVLVHRWRHWYWYTDGTTGFGTQMAPLEVARGWHHQKFMQDILCFLYKKGIIIYRLFSISLIICLCVSHNY